MSAFAIDEGGCGAGTGSYEAGLLTLSDGETCGVEDIARLTPRDDAAGKRQQTIPGFLESLRSALPAAGRLPMPARLAVSTVRAGLDVIEEGLAPENAELVAAEIAFTDGTSLQARMSPALVAVIRRDREVALGALARASRPRELPSSEDGSAEALTSIFRYEKRNGRLRRIAESEPSPKK